MKAPMMVEGVDELIAKHDAKYPDDPTCNASDGTQDPVSTRTGYTGGIQIQEFCHSVVAPTINTTHKWRE
jgi:hypothetical protein